jgi:hypothetical protein
LLNSWTEYQIWTIEETSFAKNNGILYKANAALKVARANLIWNYNWQMLKVSTWVVSTDYILAVPSITLSDTWTTDLVQIMTNKLLTYNKYESVPANYKWNWYTMTGWFNYWPTNIVIFSWSLQNLAQSWTLQSSFVDNLKTIYGWTQLSTDPNIAQVISISSQTDKENLVKAYYINWISWLDKKLVTNSSVWWSSWGGWSLVSWACTWLSTGALYYWSATTYSLSNASAWTSLTASYNATPTVNTCQFNCPATYTRNSTISRCEKTVFSNTIRLWTDDAWWYSRWVLYSRCPVWTYLTEFKLTWNWSQWTSWAWNANYSQCLVSYAWTTSQWVVWQWANTNFSNRYSNYSSYWTTTYTNSNTSIDWIALAWWGSQNSYTCNTWWYEVTRATWWNSIASASIWWQWSWYYSNWWWTCNWNTTNDQYASCNGYFASAQYSMKCAFK